MISTSKTCAVCTDVKSPYSSNKVKKICGMKLKCLLMAMDVYSWFQDTARQNLLSNYDNTLNWILCIANHISIWYMWLLQLRNLTDVKLPNTGCQKCKTKLYSITLVINADVWFQDIAKRNFTVVGSFLAEYCPLQRNKPGCLPKFLSWWVTCSW